MGSALEEVLPVLLGVVAPKPQVILAPVAEQLLVEVGLLFELLFDSRLFESDCVVRVLDCAFRSERTGGQVAAAQTSPGQGNYGARKRK